MATKTNEILVVDVSRAGVTVAVNGSNRHLGWDDLHAAANQDDPGLKAVYAGVLAQARTLARGRREVVVRVWNPSGPHAFPSEPTWCASLRTLAGEAVSARTVAADWGRTGTRSYATRDADEAVETLTARGYTVHRG